MTRTLLSLLLGASFLLVPALAVAQEVEDEFKTRPAKEELPPKTRPIKEELPPKTKPGTPSKPAPASKVPVEAAPSRPARPSKTPVSSPAPSEPSAKDPSRFPSWAGWGRPGSSRPGSSRPGSARPSGFGGSRPFPGGDAPPCDTDTHSVPELSANGSMSAFALLAGMGLLFSGRRRETPAAE